MTGFFRFPRTPHLAWFGEGQPRDDKVLAPEELRALLNGQVVVEEKVDGANLGFSVLDDGSLCPQNRGAHLNVDELGGQWKPLKRWLAPRARQLSEALFPDLMLFGEWCYAVHSIRYTGLPDWFLVFDVYDRSRGEFWSAERRDVLAAKLDLSVVPRIATGTFDLSGLEALLGSSRLTDGPPEGLYVRKDAGGHLVGRAKLVRREFVQAIGEHWSRRVLELNSVAAKAG